MKAAVFYEAEDIRVEEVDDPKPGHDDMIVEVAACGICGSDVEYFLGRSPVGTADGKGPLVLGHEFSGKIVELGAGAVGGGLTVGDRVTVNPIQSCARCDACRSGTPQFCTGLSVLGVTTNGGFAQFARTNVAHAYKVPDSLSDEQAAFVEMLAAAVNAVEKADIRPAQRVAIYGPGPVGLSMVQLAKAKGASVTLIGTRDYRLAVGAELGADHVINTGDSASPHYAADLAEALVERTGGLADRVIVGTGSIAAHEEALSISAPGATVVFMGVTGPDDHVRVPTLNSLIADKTIKFSLWYPWQWPRTIDILRQGLVDTSKIITHSAPLDDLPGAIRRVISREGDGIKTVVRIAQ